jgi:hypothetical protein
MRNVLLFAATAWSGLIVAIGPGDAALAESRLQQTPLGVAAAPAAVSASDQAADAMIIAYHDGSRTVIRVTLCQGFDCTHYRANTSSSALSPSASGYLLQADVPGLGPIEVRFGPGEGNQTTYECVSNIGTFALVGSDVEASSVQGTLGTWSLQNRTCAVWGTELTMQWNAL